LAWTEQELLAIQKAEAEATEGESKGETEMAMVSAKPKIDLTPYRIDPSALDPKRITYRVRIGMTRIPEFFKTMEMSFGKC
jgi:hypothetical protein